MKKFYYLILILFLAMFFSCREKAPGVVEIEQLPFGEVTWDGVKRADVFYEIFVRAFADSDGDGIGDLKGVADKLDYLNDLGVAGIWLMPINPSPSYHGYDVEDYKAVNPDYGTMADFDAMLAKAHSLGIKVILDFVINHTSKTHPWFTSACSSTTSQYRDYYLFSTNPQADIPAGNVPMTNYYDQWQWHAVGSGTTDYKYMGMFSDWMPDLNFHNIDDVSGSAAYAAIVDAGKFWLDKGVDGFRLDAVKHIYQSETSDENPRFLNKFYTDLKSYSDNVYMVGEVLSNNDLVAPYYAGLPALFNFEGWWKLDYAINNHHAKWYPKDMINFEAMFARYRSSFYNCTKLSNHDEDRAGSILGGDIEKMKMAAKVLLTIEGDPYLYYGEEIGMLGLKPDENVREPFLWDEAGRDAYRTEWRTPVYSTDAAVRNLAVQQKDISSLYNVYRKFMELRNADPVLASGDMLLPDGFDDADNTQKNMMAFYRVKDGVRYLVVHNVSASEDAYTISQEVKRTVAQHGGVTIGKYGPTRYMAKMPAYSTFICEL